MQHERLLEETQSRWRNAGFSTVPADKDAAEKGVQRAYKAAGLPPPVVIVWLGSPRAADTAVRLLASKIEWPHDLTPFQQSVWDQVWKQSIKPVEQHMGEQRWKSIRSTIKQHATREIENRYGQYIEKQVKAVFSERMGIAVWQYLRQIAGKAQMEKIRRVTEDKLESIVKEKVQKRIREHAFQLLVPALRQQIWEPIGEPLRISIAANNAMLDGPPNRDSCFGQHDADWLAYYDFLSKIGVKEAQILDGIKSISLSAGWWWPFETICILSERPTAINRDNRGRLHAEDSAAIRYPDGWGLYAWHGILVPQDIIMLEEPISFEMIESERNVEIRRVLIERFGLDNYLKAGKCIKLHQDNCGTLYRMNLPSDEPILVVQVVNSTPEPDGSFNEYFLRVPPTMVRARQAIAWTFGLSEEEYYPMVET
jgi:hypothetical protein